MGTKQNVDERSTPSANGGERTTMHLLALQELHEGPYTIETLLDRHGDQIVSDCLGAVHAGGCHAFCALVRPLSDENLQLCREGVLPFFLKDGGGKRYAFPSKSITTDLGRFFVSAHAVRVSPTAPLPAEGSDIVACSPELREGIDRRCKTDSLRAAWSFLIWEVIAVFPDLPPQLLTIASPQVPFRTG